MSRPALTLPFPVKGILFDLDDTLYDRDAAWARWSHAFVQEKFPEKNTTETQQIVDFLVSSDGHGYNRRADIFAELLTCYPTLSASVETLVEEQRMSLPFYIETPPETTLLLTTLVAANIPFGVITNGPPTQQGKIAAMNLEQWTSCLFISEVFGAKKPDPAIFLAAAARLEVAPADILFVGDHPRNDIWGAYNAGMHTAWLNTVYPWQVDLPREVVDIEIGSLGALLSTHHTE
jgi:putative hydrolase of the HAD superfamily